MTKREKRLLIAAIIIIISLFGTKEIILPLIEKASFINEELVESEYQLERIKLLLESFDKYQNKFTELDKENSLYESFFYSGDPVNVRLDVLDFIDGLIKELDLVIESKEFIIERVVPDSRNSQSDKDTDYGLYELLYRARLRSSYNQLLSLLESISNYEKYYGIRQIDINRTNDNRELSISLLIETYCIDGEKEGINENSGGN